MPNGSGRRGGSTTTARTSRSIRKAGEERRIELIDEGRHGLASLRRVPVFQLKVLEGMWLMNKAALLQLEHFNKSNALSWALTMGLFATPVVYSDREWNQIVGESYYIQLGPQDRFGWTEPEGKVYQIAADNLVHLKDEIYRVCYLMNQAGRSSGARQSGLSKQMDFSTTQEVLRAYGDDCEGEHETGAVGDRGGAAGWYLDRCRRAGRVRHRRIRQRSWTMPRNCWTWASARRP